VWSLTSRMTLSEFLSKVGIINNDMTCRLLTTGHYGATQTCFLIYSITSMIFTHVAAVHAGPHVGALFMCGPCSDERAEHA